MGFPFINFIIKIAERAHDGFNIRLIIEFVDLLCERRNLHHCTRGCNARAIASLAFLDFLFCGLNRFLSTSFSDELSIRPCGGNSSSLEST